MKVTCLIQESGEMRNFEYSIPVTPQKQMIDFYASSMMHSGAYDDDLNRAVLDMKRKLYLFLKNELLNVVYIAICAGLYAEMEHLYYTINYKTLDRDNYKLSESELEFVRLFKKAIIKYRGKKQTVDTKLSSTLDKYFPDNTKRLVSKQPHLSVKNIELVQHVFDEMGVSRAKSVEIAMRIFYGEKFLAPKWAADFGGKIWGDICKGWLMLNSTKENAVNEADLDKIMVAIDHIYDLEHNNGTIFDKIPSYGDVLEDRISYEWVSDLLDFKSNVTDIYQYYNICSADMKKLIAWTSHNKFLNPKSNDLFGKSFEEFSREKEKETVDNMCFVNGVWYGEKEWGDGYFSESKWVGGRWNNGFFEDSIWMGGEWRNGTFFFSKWNSGTWKNGLFMNSEFNGGDWHDGVFYKSVWRDGAWHGGWVYSRKQKDSNQKYVKKRGKITFKLTEKYVYDPNKKKRIKIYFYRPIIIETPKGDWAYITVSPKVYFG